MLSRLTIGSLALSSLLLVPLLSSDKNTLGTPLLVAEMVLEDGMAISGTLKAARIVIPEGANVRVVGDVFLIARDKILVVGVLEAADASDLDAPELNAPNLHLCSGGEIEITGKILGGTGRALGGQGSEFHVGAVGGLGSKLLLSSPNTYINGTGVVVAGDSGSSGPCAQGPIGGSVVFEGRFLTRNSTEGSVQAYGGDGAQGGCSLPGVGPAGAAGNGGNIIVVPFEGGVGEILTSELTSRTQTPLKVNLPEPADSRQDPPVVECGAQGPPGDAGAAGTGGAGADGVDGDDGTAGSPAGKDGKPGGKGGTGTGSAAGDGYTGEHCCEPQAPGGKGGKGGKGGTGTGGAGGTGGKGGDAYKVMGIPQGPGGNGGQGGGGGDGSGGQAGKGGQGGRHQGPQGDPGVKGTGTQGTPGTGGAFGAGNPDGTAGAEGPAGGEMGGAANNPGAEGNECPPQ